MKSNKGRKELSSEIATPEKLPLEVVATTALHFLGDGAESRNWNPGVQRNAILQAIRFLKMCAEQIQAEQHSDPERVGLKDDDIVPYNVGIKYITREERLDRAQAYYKAYVKNNSQRKKPLTVSEVAAQIEKDKEKGFIARRLWQFRFEFGRDRSSGRLDLRRRTKIQKTT
jgi:hypothetical protein